MQGGQVTSVALMRWDTRLGDGQARGLRGYYLCGLAFGVCPVGCILPVFLVVVGSAATGGGLLAGMAQFAG